MTSHKTLRRALRVKLEKSEERHLGKIERLGGHADSEAAVKQIRRLLDTVDAVPGDVLEQLFAAAQGDAFSEVFNDKLMRITRPPVPQTAEDLCRQMFAAQR